jgi:hypothetical protein
MKGKGLRKSLACGEKLAMYKAGGMVGRPAKKYVFQDGQGPMLPTPPGKKKGCSK